VVTTPFWTLGEAKKATSEDSTIDADNAWSYGENAIKHIFASESVSSSSVSVSASNSVSVSDSVSSSSGSISSSSSISISISFSSSSSSISVSFSASVSISISISSSSGSISASGSNSASTSVSSSSTSVSASSSQSASTSTSTSVSSSSVSHVPSTWLPNWRKRIKITLDKDQVAASLSNFPVPIYLSASSGQTSADVSAVFDELTSDANRFKIAITEEDGTTQLYVEIERWDDTNEQAWLHVKVPVVYSSSDTYIYLYYDSLKPDNTTYVGDAGSTVAENVWDSNFALVYHMQGDPSVEDSILDSTANGYDGNGFSMESEDEVAGKFGNCLRFDGIDESVTATSGSKLDDIAAMTIEALIYDKSTSEEGVCGKCTGYNSGGWTFTITDTMKFMSHRATVDGAWNAGSISLNTWTSVGITYDRSSVDNDPLMYKDGVSQLVNESATPNGTADTDAAWVLYIADIKSNTWGFEGDICEIRVSKVIRTASWIGATHQGLFDNLLTFSSEESGSYSSSSSVSASASASASQSASTSVSTSVSASSSSQSVSDSSSSFSTSTSVSTSVSISGSPSSSSTSTSVSASVSASASTSNSSSSLSSESISSSSESVSASISISTSVSSSSVSTSASNSSSSSESVSSSSISSESISSESISVSASSSSSSHDPIVHVVTMHIELTPHTPEYVGYYTGSSPVSLTISPKTATYPLYGRMGQPKITGSKPKVICTATKAYVLCKGRDVKTKVSGY